MRRILAPSALAFAILGAAAARANNNDLVLSRLGTADPGGNGVTPDEAAFRSLASELGVVTAPKMLSPADTMGYSGFQFSTELSFNTINGSKPYWRGAAGAKPSDTKPEFAGEIPTIGLFVRKGI